MHLACEGSVCKPVPIEGPDLCNQAFGCGGMMHTLCEQEACISVTGPGGNTCTTQAGCGTTTHTVCNEDQCLPVSGPGGNECVAAQDCLQRLCGNGTLEPLAGEFCDDGNRRNGDGCSSICTTEMIVASGITCGDGIQTPPEECDDRNAASGDGCTSACTMERVSMPLPQGRCADGTLNSGETCDDRNTRSGDGCSSTCQLEQPAQFVTSTLRCGDGIVTIGEGCDDGNNAVGDGCDALCRREREEACTSPDQCASGLCDASQICQWCKSGDACAGGICTPNGDCRRTLVAQAQVAGRSTCGDGVLSSPEECDDRNNRDRDGCSARCFFEEGSCGDGFIERALDEACEPILMPTGDLPYRCDSVTCRYVSISCGDGHMDLGEACDMGTLNSDLPGSPCRSDCNAPRCGDGIHDLSETCDDGNMLDGDSCPWNCGSARVIAGMSEVAGLSGLISFPGFHGTPDAMGRVLGSYSLDPITGEPYYPTVPGTQVLPWQLPLASVQQTATSRAPIGDTGPAAVAVIAAGAASGVAWMRRKRRGTRRS